MSDIKELYQTVFDIIEDACKITESSVYENNYPFPLIKLTPLEIGLKTILCPFIVLTGIIAILGITTMVLCFLPLWGFYDILYLINKRVYKRAKNEKKDVNLG